LGRKRLSNPTPQTTIHISIQAFEFIEGHRRLHEPLYRAVDRILSDFEEIRQAKLELELINQDLRESLEINRLKRMDLERRLDKMSSVIV
jgi:hypothetical protein